MLSSLRLGLVIDVADISPFTGMTKHRIFLDLHGGPGTIGKIKS
jgi:hypothetical protein